MKAKADALLPGFIESVKAFSESLKGFEAYIDAAFNPPKLGPTCWCSFCGASDLEQDFLVKASHSPLAPAVEIHADTPVICDSCVSLAAQLIDESRVAVKRSRNWHEDGEGDCG